MFHNEFKNNFKNAIPKEEGCKNDETKLFKNIKILSDKNFHLEDSDDEDSILGPKTNNLLCNIYFPKSQERKSHSGRSFHI